LNALTALRDIFGERLCSDAEQLLEHGATRDVRVLQGGAVVTGVVGSARVYIRRSNGKIEGECSCNERGPCVHVAAVSIAAERSPAAGAQAPAVARRTLAEAAVTPRSAAAQQQRLCYLLTQPATPGGGLQVAVWIGQEGTHAFSLRPPAGGADYPRYVQPNDREILAALSSVALTGAGPTSAPFDGPRVIADDGAYALLTQIVNTGRAFWLTLRSQVLRPGPARNVDFSWVALADGDQELRAAVDTTVAVFPEIDPPIYIDSANAEIGQIESHSSITLVRRYWDRPTVAPEQVAIINEQIASELSAADERPNDARDAASLARAGLATLPSNATPFPPLRTLPVEKRPLTTLTPRLTLSPGPAATLYYVYNGLPVDSRRLQDEHACARQMMDGVLYEIPRDLGREEQFRRRLADVLPSADQDREAWLGFLLNACPALKADHWEIQVADAFPYRLAKADDWYGDLESDRRQGWFNLRLGVVVDGQHVNLLPALARYLQTTLAESQTSLPTDAAAAEPAAPLGNAGCRVGDQWLIHLDDGRYLPVAIERIQRIAHTLVELFDRDGLTKQQALSLPKSHTGRIVQLARDLNTLAPPGAAIASPGAPRCALTSATSELRALVDDLESSGGIQPLTAPPGFRAELRPYQQEGLGWLQFLRRHHLGGILADDMGLGKTVQTLAHLMLEKQQGRLQRPALIVAPVSTLGNWQQELHRFAPELTGLVLHGSRRRESFSLIDKVDVVITGYPLLQLDSEILLAKDYYLIILDEAQMIKNPKAKVSAVARALRAEHRLALTGTPVENHLGELWSLFDFAQPGLLGEERHFQRHYRTPVEKDGNRLRAQALAQRVAPFLLRRTKDAVAKDLPPKTEIVETLALDERQRDFYDGIRLASHRHIQEVVQQQGLARSQITILDALLKLRQACCDPRLLGVAAEKADVPSAKLEWLSSALPELIAEGRRVLLFSQFTSMLRLIESTVSALGIPYCLLTGETQNRPDVIARFQSGAVPLFLISLKAGGTGLNLTAADTVIHYDPWWNPAVEAQATDRAHRIGQDKPVFVYKLIARGTVEERILQLQADKHALASRLYTQSTGSPASLTPADIEALFAP
jgi:superfamily II DNA or RNA helicase